METRIIADVSWHKGLIDWPALIASNGIIGSITKATDGWRMIPTEGEVWIRENQYEDPRFRQNMAGAAPLDYRGMYAFFRPNDERARKNGLLTMEGQVALYGDLYKRFAVSGEDISAVDFEPSAADVEGLTPAKVADRLWWYMTACEAVTGQPQVLYTNQNDWNVYLANSGHNWNKFLLWFAWPLTNPVDWQKWLGKLPLGKGMNPDRVALWQHSWKGRFAGIDYDTDANVPQAAFDQLPKRVTVIEPEPAEPQDMVKALANLIIIVGKLSSRVAALEYQLAKDSVSDPNVTPTNGKRYKVVEPATMFIADKGQLVQVTGMKLSQGHVIGIGTIQNWKAASRPVGLYGKVVSAPHNDQLGLWVRMQDLKVVV